MGYLNSHLCVQVMLGSGPRGLGHLHPPPPPFLLDLLCMALAQDAIRVLLTCELLEGGASACSLLWLQTQRGAKHRVSVREGSWALMLLCCGTAGSLPFTQNTQLCWEDRLGC